jgi:hypothetical protein
MADLIEAAATVEGRLFHAEKTLTEVRIAVARVETKLVGHEESVAEFRKENAAQYQDLKAQLASAQTQTATNISKIMSQLEPLREAKWKASGAYTAMAAVVSAAISLAIKFWK